MDYSWLKAEPALNMRGLEAGLVAPEGFRSSGWYVFFVDESGGDVLQSPSSTHRFPTLQW